MADRRTDRPADGGDVGVRARQVLELQLFPSTCPPVAPSAVSSSASPPVRPSALPVLDQRLRGTKFVSLSPKSLLNSPQQTGVDFWSLNPYVGCEFGCTYCYARYAHRYVVERAHDAGKLSDDEFREFRGPQGWEAFERRIFVKERTLGALESDLQRYFRSAGRSHAQPAPIVIGTATDPYQPAERHFRITRRILERLACCEGLNLGIITKRSEEHTSELQSHSDLVCRLLLEKKKQEPYDQYDENSQAKQCD